MRPQAFDADRRAVVRQRRSRCRQNGRVEAALLPCRRLNEGAILIESQLRRAPCKRFKPTILPRIAV